MSLCFVELEGFVNEAWYPYAAINSSTHQVRVRMLVRVRIIAANIDEGPEGYVITEVFDRARESHICWHAPCQTLVSNSRFME